ncbi:hypothetical protein ACA910_005178 [Epithemia clementina (nom. ined.)]
MPLPQRWNNNKKRQKTPPEGFDYVEPVLEALEHELRDVVQERDPTKRKTEALWPIHQLNWQKSRYIYDLYHVHQRISKAVYQYCLQQKLVDALLMAKWSKPGYERLCSLYVIDARNYKFGTSSICRVPWKDRSEAQHGVHDPTTGCLGCFSGPGALNNIFGNKYGQYLAAIQIAREQRAAALRQQRLPLPPPDENQNVDNKDEDDEDEDEEEGPQRSAAQAEQAPTPQSSSSLPPPPPSNDKKRDQDEGDAPTDDDDDDNAETDDDNDDDDEDFGPSPAAGIWAGSQKLERKSQQLSYPKDEQQDVDHGREELDANDDDNGHDERLSKMARS